ncbi:carboxymuconolactone decarboxylase family protein [Streptomyces canus]|uniref:carboxymuconolactone decarboxylase family protein n=1 Tax=Streptomyces canus TaxID=58343 RepID=UPI00367BB1D4
MRAAHKLAVPASRHPRFRLRSRLAAPGLTLRERRIITVACVALDDSPVPLQSHVTAALHSGDIAKEEMDEIVLHFAAYYGFAKGEALADAVERAWSKRPD